MKSYSCGIRDVLRNIYQVCFDWKRKFKAHAQTLFPLHYRETPMRVLAGCPWICSLATSMWIWFTRIGIIIATLGKDLLLTCTYSGATFDWVPGAWDFQISPRDVMDYPGKVALLVPLNRSGHRAESKAKDSEKFIEIHKRAGGGNIDRHSPVPQGDERENKN